MLGCSSEKAILLLCDSLGNAIQDSTKRKKYFNELGNTISIFEKYSIFKKKFSLIKNKLPKELKYNVDSHLEGIFNLIRDTRNEAGHPALGGEIDQDTVDSHLRLFVPYCKRVYGLIEWLEKNEI